MLLHPYWQVGLSHLNRLLMGPLTKCGKFSFTVCSHNVFIQTRVPWTFSPLLEPPRYLLGHRGSLMGNPGGPSGTNFAIFFQASTRRARARFKSSIGDNVSTLLRGTNKSKS